MQRERTSNLNRPTPVSHKAQRLVQPLLAWFGQNARDLPWRRTQNPYAIWISEIMLQQTQVKTVIPYWKRWMQELPTIQSLARARLPKILKLWEGLGYYTRARNLKRAAQMIVKNHHGRFPEDFDEVLALPGIGRYTAGAICSIAFNQPTPILDGNVIRVLTRLFGIDGNPREKGANTILWELAETLVREAARTRRGRARNCSHLNQSLMELGATICTPRQPKCPRCPVRKHCVAFRNGRVAELPNLGERVASSERRFVAFVAHHHGRFLVHQRPTGAVNAHLWEFPNIEVTSNHADIPRLAHGLLGPCRLSPEPSFRLKHTITRYRMTLDVFSVESEIDSLKRARYGRWCSSCELKKLAFPSAHRKIADRISRGFLADKSA